MSLALREDDPGHPSRHALARHEAGEGSPAERAALESHLGACPACAEVLAGIAALRSAFHASHPRGDLAAALEAREATRPPARPLLTVLRWPLGLGSATAAVIGLLLLLLPSGQEQAGAERVKGAALSLGFLIEVDGRAVVAEPGRSVRAGDRIQFLLSAPAGGFLHVLGVDGAGQVSVYHPAPGVVAGAFPGGAGRPVPGSVILDDTAGPERIFALLCEAAREPAALAAEVRALAPDPRVWLTSEALPLAGCRQATLLLVKE